MLFMISNILYLSDLFLYIVILYFSYHIFYYILSISLFRFEQFFHVNAPMNVILNAVSCKIYIIILSSYTNSVPKASLGGKALYEVFAYFYGYYILKKLNIKML